MEPYSFKYGDGHRPLPLPEVTEDAALFGSVLEEVHGLFIERNNIYRSRFREEGLTGVLGRIGDKMQRLVAFMDHPPPNENEDLTEHFLDLAVYAVLGALLNHYGNPGLASCRHLFVAEPSSGTAQLPHQPAASRCIFCRQRATLWLDGKASQ